MIAFFVAILSFVWTTGASTDDPGLPGFGVATVLRVGVTGLVGIGFVYFCFVVRTFARYGGLGKMKNMRGAGGTAGGGGLGGRAQREDVRSLQGVINGMVGMGGPGGASGNESGVRLSVEEVNERGRKYSASENGDLEKGNMVLEDIRQTRPEDRRTLPRL
jgi:hypothetical protein